MSFRDIFQGRSRGSNRGREPPPSSTSTSGTGSSSDDSQSSGPGRNPSPGFSSRLSRLSLQLPGAPAICGNAPDDVHENAQRPNSPPSESSGKTWGSERSGDREQQGDSEGERESDREAPELPEVPNPQRHPVLRDPLIDIDPDLEMRQFQSLKGRLTKTHTKGVLLRQQRLTRPVFDPSFRLINYGHRRWPIQVTPKYLNDIMSWLWPGGIGIPMEVRKHGGWEGDQAFHARVTRLVQEFNAHGLPRTVHANLDHEPRPGLPRVSDPDIINPSYRCPCWIKLLGEEWYNETDATILKKLGNAWANDGQSLLIHLLTRLITAMTQTYLKESKDTFVRINPHLQAKPYSTKWSDDILALIEFLQYWFSSAHISLTMKNNLFVIRKFLHTRGKDKIRGRNSRLVEDDRKMLAGLCGLFTSQVVKKILQSSKRDSEAPIDEGSPDVEIIGERRGPNTLRAVPDPAIGPLLQDVTIGLSVAAEKRRILALGPRPRNLLQQLTLRSDRMHRPIHDPSHPLINYGHRRWPFIIKPDYLNEMMSWLWPGGLGVRSDARVRDAPWHSDTAYFGRVVKLTQEFNAHGLPRTVHAKLEHESPQGVAPDPEAINPSYRCPCWINHLGEHWYNATDATILRNLGNEWINSGQHLLIHLLERMITAMTQSYVKDSSEVFMKNNPHLQGRPYSTRFSDQIIALLEKFLQTRGVDEGRNLRDNDKQLVAQLSGLSKYQILRKLQRDRYNEKKAGLQPMQQQLPLRLDEQLYLDKYLLRKKIFQPEIFQRDLPVDYFKDFKREVAKHPKDPKLESKVKAYAIHFLSSSKGDQGRKGFKVRSEAIAYYNLIAASKRGEPYDPIEGTRNNRRWCEMVVDHMESVMTRRYNEAVTELRKLSDYESRDHDAILRAGNKKLGGDSEPSESGVEEEEEEGSEGGEGGDDSPEVKPASPPKTTKRKRTAGGRRPRDAFKKPAIRPENSPPEEGDDFQNSVEFLRLNFGPGSVQEQIQPLLLDQATGADRNLTSDEMRDILSSSPAPDRAQRPRGEPPADLAFPDIYDELYEEHEDRAKRPKRIFDIFTKYSPQVPAIRPWKLLQLQGPQEMPSEFLPPEPEDPPPKRDPSPPPSPHPSGSPPPGASPGGGGPPDGPPPDPPPPEDPDDVLWARFVTFAADVEEHFPEMTGLLTGPTIFHNFLAQMVFLHPILYRYIYLPRVFPPRR